MSAAMVSAVLVATATPAAAATPVSQTIHVQLGFTSTFPISESVSDGFLGVDYEFSVNGTATVRLDLGADITITYDREDLVPGGMVPVQVTFQPTDDAGPEFDLDVTANIVADVDVSAGTFFAACLPLSPLFALCPLLVALDSIDADLNNFQLVGASANFLAPLGADPAVVIPASGDTAVLSFAGVVDLLSVQVASSITLGPVPAGGFPGLGGAATVATPVGATLVGGELPGIADMLEWQAAGSSQTVTLQLPGTPGATAGINMAPIYHWLSTSASIAIDLDFEGPFTVLPDPDNISIFSGSLGQIFVDNGIDVQIGNAVAAAIGFDPGFAAQVAAGNLPAPLTNPPISAIPPVPTLGGIGFTIDLDADDDGLLDGEELLIGTDPDDPDTDDDGIPDGQDVEFLQNAINALSDGDFQGVGNRTAILSMLNAVEKRVAQGQIDQAIDLLQILRTRVDGCGASADVNDWIVDCAAQLQTRELVDLLIANLS